MFKVRFVDSNVFIYVMLKDPLYGKTALDILLRFEKGSEFGVTSTLALSQVLAHLSRRGRQEAIDKFYDYLESIPIDIIETSQEDFQRAKEIKEKLNLSWEIWDDLVIASQMRRKGIKEIYSNDKDFDLIKGVRRIFR